jgi:ABC-type multidrug transport system permease subunit
MSYLLSSTLVQFPFQLVLAVVYNVISWWLVGLTSDADVFFFQIFAVFTVIVAGNTCATLISTIVPNAMAGQTAGAAIFSVMFLFSGFFIKRSSIPGYWVWLHYLSMFKYAYDSIVINALDGHFSLPMLSNDEVMKALSVDGINRGMGVGILWCFVVVMRGVIYFRLMTAFSGSRK